MMRKYVLVCIVSWTQMPIHLLVLQMSVLCLCTDADGRDGWCVVCVVWCVVYDKCCVVCDVWCVVYDECCVVWYVCCVVYDVWCMMFV